MIWILSLVGKLSECRGFYTGAAGEGGGGGEEIVRFVTYNNQNSRNGGLKLELCRMAQSKIDMGLLQDTKIIDGVYSQETAGFFVIALDALSRHCGGVALFYKELPRLVVESQQQHGPNAIIFQLVTVGKHYNMVE